jgi:trehalose 6-phosphate synthase
VMIHDYHLYLVAPHVRAHCPGAFLHHFVHVPWPQPDSWRVLPAWMRESLLAGLLANDIVAFHTERYARNFVLCCQELLGLTVDVDSLMVDLGERRVAARWYPISVDVSRLEALAGSPEVQEQERQLENSRREFLILRVDRTDLSKNVLRGFLAYDQMLTEHPELTGRVTFLALLQPSRQDVDEYLEYVERIRRLVADINLKHGNTDWQPIDLRFQESLPTAVAAYKLFNALMVNSVFDGLNLVAKEAMVVNRMDGVLVLSEHAGAYDELGAFALGVHPFDIGQQADALYRALTMPREERRARQQMCIDIVRTNDLDKWLRRQLDDIAEMQSMSTQH